MKFKVGDMLRVKTWDELVEEGYKLNEGDNNDTEQGEKND